MRHHRKDLSPLAAARTALERAQQALRDATRAGSEKGQQRARERIEQATNELEEATAIAAAEGTWATPS